METVKKGNRQLPGVRKERRGMNRWDTEDFKVTRLFCAIPARGYGTLCIYQNDTKRKVNPKVKQGF